jgi:hypothetical protein
MTSRRDFFRGGAKGAGLLGAFAAGLAAPIVIEKTKEIHVKTLEPSVPTVDPKVVEKIKEFASSGILELHRTYGEVAPPEPNPSPYMFTNSLGGPKLVPGTENNVRVGMMVGPDGELYIRVKDDWKKVLTT